MRYRLMGLLGCWVVLSGCTTTQEAQPDDPNYAPLQASSIARPVENHGGIYQDGYAMSLFETVKARRIGDIITVNLIEKTNATAKATSTTKKDSSTGINTPTLLGSKPVSGDSNSKLVDLSRTSKFDGQGESKQNNSLQGSITVTVVDQLPNGNLVIRGEKWLMINQSKEFIRLRGIIRQQDISLDNTVESTKVADARITYSGVGQVADSNKISWLGRFFSHIIWPF